MDNIIYDEELSNTVVDVPSTSTDQAELGREKALKIQCMYIVSIFNHMFTQYAIETGLSLGYFVHVTVRLTGSSVDSSPVKVIKDKVC